MILIRGAALAETVYPDPALRHSHDIEILVEDGYVEEATRLLIPLGFAPPASAPKTDAWGILMIHESGLPLVLRHKIFQIHFQNAAQPKMCARAVEAQIATVPVRILSPADALFHSCAEVSYPINSGSYRWIIDAWFIIKRYQDLNWNCLLETAKESHSALAVSATLNYLAEELSSPIPSISLRPLMLKASAVSSLSCELALFRARASDRGGFKNLIRAARSWHGRLLILKWMLLPSTAYMVWVSQLRHVWLLPVQYLYRPVRYLSARIRLSLSQS